MAFEVANEAFEKAFGKSTEKEEKRQSDGFMQMLNVYLRGRKEWAAGAIRAWLKKGGKLCAFRCREDVVQPVIDELIEKAVPFVLVKTTTGNTGFLIRDEDSRRAKAAVAHVLDSMSGYCEITTGEQAGLIYRRAKEKDKAMLHLCGLSEEEIFFLEEEARETLPGKAVGVDRMPDGTYMVTCHGKSIFTDPPTRTFYEALAESRLISSGECAEGLKQRKDSRKKYLKEKAAGFPDQSGGMGSPVWIVGNGTAYVKRTEEGFESGHAEEAAGEIFLARENEVLINDTSYERRMNSALSKITGHICLYSMNDVLEHFKKKRSDIRDIKETGQRRLVQSAAEIVAAKEAADIRKKGGKLSWKKRMELYQDSIGMLLMAARDGVVPAGYKKADILRLRRIIRTFGLDMNRVSPGLEKMRATQIFEREAGPAPIADIEKVLATIRGEDMDLGISAPSRSYGSPGLDR